MRYAQRTAHLQAEGAYQVMARALQLEAKGHEIIHLEIGQPDFETYSYIRAAGAAAIQNGKTRYTAPAGLRELRESIAGDAGARRGIVVQPQEVVVSPGAKPNLFFPMMALVEPGDEVIYPDPGFPSYEATIRLVGGVPAPVPLVEAENFSFDLGVFDQQLSPRIRVIILNSPGNPTGGVIPMAGLEHIADAARRHDIWVISDEIYSRLVYDGLTAHSIASLPGMQERTIIVDGFSKTYAMTGWRLGYGIMPVELARRVELLLTHSVGSTAHFTQVAGIEAISGEQGAVEEMLRTFEHRREVIISGLNNLPGVSCQMPQGAFYAFPNITDLGVSSESLADMLLEEAGVALLPGSGFGQHGEGYLRLSYANSIDNIQLGLARMLPVFERLMSSRV